MKITRRQFGRVAAASAAAGLMLPQLAKAQATTAMKTFATPAPGMNIHPLLAKRDQKAILTRIQGLMQRDGFGALVVVKPEWVLYSTGYYSKFGYAPGAPAGTQAVAVIPAEGDTAHLFINVMESDDAARMTQGVEVSAMPGFVFVDDGTPESREEKSGNLDPLAGFKDALSAAQDFAGGDKIGIEMGMLLGVLANYMNSQVQEGQVQDSTSLIDEARLIKTPWEIDMLRMAAQHSERVQSRVAQQLEPGMNAIVLDNLIQTAAWEEDKEGSLATMAYQLGIGPYWGVSWAPRNYVIQRGDLCRIDGGGQHFGYISDITRTWAVGGSPTSKHVETYDGLYAGFLKGIEMLKPGVKMSEMYAEVRAEVEKSPIFPVYARGHVGHSISVAPTLEDNPKFSPGVDVVFEPGMVVSLETSYMAAEGAYAPGPYNIEDSFAITEDEHERFTTAPDSVVWDGTLTTQ
jgi:Xaa-Pro aminopeptidase